MTKENLLFLLDSKEKTENLVICSEELAELIKEISKSIRGHKNTKNLIEEVADVTIVLEMLKLIFDINDDVLEKEINRKMKRNLVRAGADL